ncbi:M61 family metallopeptidase [Roseateles sp. NT4]|uniref:M61 family metallopeptidase n=1 Tax=Roseateles sp. NT4 TaxID=3453715 RepID=UPI003EECC29B
MKPISHWIATTAMWIALAAAGTAGARAAETLTVNVDASNTGQGIVQVGLTLPVHEGRLRLLYPLWLPGYHGPVGHVAQIGGLVVMLGAQRLPWRRAPNQPQAFDIDVPRGATTLDISYQWLGADSGPVAPLRGRDLLGVAWTSLLLYPAGRPMRDYTVDARLRLPAGWGWGSALRERPAPTTPTGWIAFEPEPLDTLMDSPVYAGAFHRRIELDAPGTPRPVTLHLFGDEPARIAASDAQVEALRQLVRQADALFGARPWRHYDMLLANAEALPIDGLEHHESTEMQLPGNFLEDWATAERMRNLVAHEFVHAWNGKLRRPATLLRDDLNTPTSNELLWVYEGLTTYWGHVLSARSGVSTPAQVQRALALMAAYQAQQPRRSWRPLQDTVNDAMLPRPDDLRWGDWFGGFDYYPESALRLWLGIDALIRERSEGRRSLDDFARVFVAARDGERRPRPYGFDDVVAALNQVQPLDWRGLLRERLDGLRPATGAPAPSGLEHTGWRLAFADARSALDLASVHPKKPSFSMLYSVGVTVASDGKLQQVSWDSPAFRQGLAPGDQLLAVQGRAYTPERAEAALKAARDDGTAMEWLVKRDDDYRVVSFDGRSGPRYPRLERVDGTPDRLADILKPR